MRTHNKSLTSREPPIPDKTPSEWRPDFASLRGRIYLAVATQIEQAIRSEVFKPGDKLPSQRAIADHLGFHVNTINAAFKEAARRGLVKSCARRGTIVLRHDG